MKYYLTDKTFLKQLDLDNNKRYWVRIELLNFNEEVIGNIEGKIQPGSTISINGSSTIRRTCNLNFIAENENNDLTNIENDLSINKKIRIVTCIENNIDDQYDKIVEFPLGIFVINQPTITHNLNSCIISLSCKDKMCLLDGTCGGGLPAPITFHEYEQIIGLLEVPFETSGVEELDQIKTVYGYDNNDKPKISGHPNTYTIYKVENGTKYYRWSPVQDFYEIASETAIDILKNPSENTESIPQRIYDIIQTLVCNYGGEDIGKMYINDVPLTIKQLVRYVGTDPIYLITQNNSATFTYTENSNAQKFIHNQDVGYTYTDFVYPGKLISGVGESVVSVLNKIKNTLGNYEFFYDVDGNFVFQEIRNYLNTSYDPADTSKLNNKILEFDKNGLCLIDDKNYKIDIYSNTRSVYTFNQKDSLINSFQNTPDYTNIKNDFHIWGKHSDNVTAIHYHLVIKEKPRQEDFGTYSVVFLLGKDGLLNGKIRLKEAGDPRLKDALTTNDGIGRDKAGNQVYNDNYKPDDWRAELYLRGLVKQQSKLRPDVYEQELLDLFDSIYDFQKKEFRADIVKNPNELTYWFDYLEPTDNFYNYSVDFIGSRVYSYQMDKINRLFTGFVPNYILLSTESDSIEYKKLHQEAVENAEECLNLPLNIYDNIMTGTFGYTAQDTARELLYQYTNYNESISIQSIPIYYLDVNTRITVNDPKSGIQGDYIIKNISLPVVPTGFMSISATRALERI